MWYWDYIIKKEQDHVKVESPEGIVWRADTVEEAKQDIEDVIQGKALFIRERSDDSGN